ncbi:hypothetical protein ACJDU8_25180 [Clostridium sp. WILCCON 0269]|uniref:Uncharacterized protein n=1 Tax=Candidatus Clostridium eludens TaxID=3381663 RepID=A0ABW8SRX0_9CLOT
MATEHDNEFDFEASTNVTSISFKFNDNYVITDGQPWGGVSSDGGKIIVKAGRSGSEKCAKWFKDYVASNCNNMIHTCDGDNLPDKLNFAIQGILTVDGQNFEVCIGQGHRDSTGENNWHIASKSIIADADAKNGALGIRMLQDGTYGFKLSRG